MSHEAVLLDLVFLLPVMQVDHSQPLSADPRPLGPAQIPRPLQAVCSLLPVQRGKLVTGNRSQHPTSLSGRYLSCRELSLAAANLGLLLGVPAGSVLIALACRASASLPKDLQCLSRPGTYYLFCAYVAKKDQSERV